MDIAFQVLYLIAVLVCGLVPVDLISDSAEGIVVLQINRKKAPDLRHGDELLSLEYRAQILLYISTSYISIIGYNHFQLQIL